VYIGIDWSETKHDVVILNEAGAALERLVLPHTPEGLCQLETARQRLGLKPEECLVGIETAHHLVIDFLWAHGYTQVYVIPPNVVKSSRSRYRQSGARDDQSDAYVIADVTRTDRHRLALWRPDGLLTRQLRAAVSLREHLQRARVRCCNRLRAVLLRYYPAATQVFKHLDAQITLAFIQAYPTPQAASALSFAAFKTFAQQHHYPRPAGLRTNFARLQASQPEATPDTIQVYQGEAVCLAALLLSVVQAQLDVERDVGELFARHPERALFASLPGAGDWLAPALLAKFGDDRQRFPTAASVQALAGTCPVTESSNKRRWVHFRRACDREFRHIAQQWARCSLKESTWAVAYYERIRPHCHSESHAQRCLANRWLAIAWKVWQSRRPYDEAVHLQHRAARSRPRPREGV
jgi:transposase